MRYRVGIGRDGLLARQRRHSVASEMAALEVAEPPKDIKPSKDGFLLIDRARFTADFGADLPKDQAELMARSQMPMAVVATDAEVWAAAWHENPSYAIVAKDDKSRLGALDA